MTVPIRPIGAREKDEWLKLCNGPDSYLEFYKAMDVVSDGTAQTMFALFS